MDFKHEFGTVDLILNTDFETRGVDAFILSLIKIEKQLRRIFTHLVYQHSSYSTKDINELKSALETNKRMYFDSFILGINKISNSTIKDLYGEAYEEDLVSLNKYKNYRNKIFHGQLTSEKLSRKDLIECVDDMKKWSERVAHVFTININYDGFKRNSYHKSTKTIILKNMSDFESIEAYKNLLNEISR